MGLFDQFPYTNFHELNLDWLLRMIKELNDTVENFVALNTIKYADPIQWNITTQYEANTVVVDPQTGTAYISSKAVPSGVALTNTDYWSVIFTLDIISANKNITLRDDGSNVLATFASNAGDWLIWNGVLYKVTQNININEAYVIGYNITRYTIEQFLTDAVTSLQTAIDNVQQQIDDINDGTVSGSLQNQINNMNDGAVSGSLQNQIDTINTSMSDVFAIFDNVNDMINADISDGKVVATVGYNNVNDGGGAVYKIESTAGNLFPITLSNGLYANIQNYKYIDQLGGLGNGSTYIDNYISTVDSLGLPIELLPSKSYKIHTAINLSISVNFNGNSSAIESDDGTFFDFSGGYSGNVIENLTLVGGDVTKYAIVLGRPECTFRNIKYNGNSSFMKLTGVDAYNSAYSTTVDHCEYSILPTDVINAERNGIEIDVLGGQIRIKDCNFATVNRGIVCKRGSNVVIDNCNISGCRHTYFSDVSSKSVAIEIINSTATVVKNNYIEDSDQAVLLDGSGYDALLIGNMCNMFNYADAVIEANSFTNITSIANRYQSSKTGSIGILVNDFNTKRFVSVNDWFFQVTTNISGKVVELGNSRLNLYDSIVDEQKFEIKNVGSSNATITQGGRYYNPSLSTGGTQNITLNIPSNGFFEFYAYANNITVNIAAGGRTFTKTLTHSGGSGSIRVQKIVDDYILVY